MLSVHIEISHTLATQSVLQCLSNILGTNSHDTGLVTVNLNTGFRLTELQVYVCHLKDRILIYFSHKLGQYFFQLLQISSLKHILDRHTSTTSSERRLLLHKRTCHCLAPYFFRNLFGNFHLRVVTIFHVFQRDTHVSATTGYTGSNRFCVRKNGIDKLVDIFRIIPNIFISDTLCTSCVDTDLRTVFKRSHFRRNSIP